MVSIGVRSTSRGFITTPDVTTHTVTIRSGPRAGEVAQCTCPRQSDHYLRMAPGLMDTHPTLF